MSWGVRYAAFLTRIEMKVSGILRRDVTSCVDEALKVSFDVGACG